MADNNDMQSHVATYSSVISLLFYGAITVFVIAAFVIWLIAPAGK